ncbi:hypothetical protein FS749_006849 [Ceratobasidium sp. UAMH 11750]|nr:hypothetical protein FS749_006849 [Ceratobasidium sp. UAMH 11750]
MTAYNEHVRTAYTHLLVSIILPTLFFALALVLADNSSSSTILSILALSCILPLAVHTSIYSRLSIAQTTRQTSAQPRLYDLFWVLPAALYASISTLQRYFMVALYALTMSPGYQPSRGFLGLVYMLGVMEWTTVSQLSVMLWRTSRENGMEDIEKSGAVRIVDVPIIIVTALE